MAPLSVTEDIQSLSFTFNILYRQEILLTTAAREPQPDFRSRRNHDLMLVIEDQWRKQLHEEQVQEEADRRKKEASRVESIVAKEGRRSRQEREGVGNRVEGGKQEGTTDGEGRRSFQDVAADRRGLEERIGEIQERGDWKEVTTEESFVENAMERKEKRRSTGKVTSSEKDVEIENGTKKPTDGTLLKW